MTITCYRLSVWESRWDMEFNPSKCQVVQVTTSRKTSIFSYILYSHVLEVVSSRYLGVDISNGLLWNSYIDRMPSKAISTLGFIKRNIKTKNVRVKETAYNTLVRPQLEYAGPIWDPHTKQKKIQLEKVQHRAVRWTTSNYDYWSSVTAMLQSVGWRILEQRRTDARLCLFYKIVYDLVAVSLPVYVQQPNRLSRHCHSTTFTQIHTSKDFLQVCILSFHWNALPQHVVCLPTIYSYKEAIAL